MNPRLPAGRPRAPRSGRCIATLYGGALLVAAIGASATEAACPPAGFDIAALRALRQEHFAMADAERRRALAIGLLACLTSPDSELRDRIGYEAFAYWRIGKVLDAAAWSRVVAELRPRLSAPADPSGVAAPFAALVLAEAVHADRDTPFLDDAQRRTLLDDAAGYFTSVRDYRGFDEKTGWRHGVAHGADLLGELALEPNFGAVQLERILAALASQVVAHDDHVYVFGESERIAVATARVAGRGLLERKAWKAWLAAVTTPAPLARWGDAYDSMAGVAKRENTMQFLLNLYAELATSDDDRRHALAADVTVAMQPLR